MEDPSEPSQPSEPSNISPRRSKASRIIWRTQYEHFRQRLILARERARLTQREAAELLGRSPSFVAKSETGERRVDVVELMEFARVYRKRLWWFARPDRPPRK